MVGKHITETLHSYLLFTYCAHIVLCNNYISLRKIARHRQSSIKISYKNTKEKTLEIKYFKTDSLDLSNIQLVNTLRTKSLQFTVWANESECKMMEKITIKMDLESTKVTLTYNNCCILFVYFCLSVSGQIFCFY